MKTTHLFSTSLACVLLATQTIAATDAITGWNAELNLAQQAYNESADGRDRADAILRAGLDAARNGLANELPPAGANLNAATAQAAYSVLSVLYPGRISSLGVELAESLSGINDTASAIAAGRAWGSHVAEVVLAEQRDASPRDTFRFAESGPASVTPAASSPLQNETIIGPGRYRFSVLAGAPGTKGYVDGVGAGARFDNPGGIAVDVAGNVYVSEHDLNTIRKISPDGMVTTLAGNSGQKGGEDGAGAAARFNQPSGLAVDAAGNVFVADTNNHTIRKIDPAGNVTTVAGTAGQSGATDGSRANARFSHPHYVAVDAAGSLFVTGDTAGGPLIRKIAPDGTVATLAILAVLNHIYYQPEHIRVDRAGNVFVSVMISLGGLWDDSGVVKLTPPGKEEKYTASEIAPSEDYFGDPIDFSIDESDNLYVRSAGDPFHIYSPDGKRQDRYPAGISYPHRIAQFAAGKSGQLFVVRNQESDQDRFGVVETGIFDPEAKGPVLLYPPQNFSNSVGDSASFFVRAAGGPNLTFQWYLNSTPIAGATGGAYFMANVQATDAGKYFVVFSDSDGSITSETAQFTVNGSRSPAPVSPPALSPQSPEPSSPAASSSGGGSFDQGSALAVLMLLAVAAKRRRVFSAAPAEPFAVR